MPIKLRFKLELIFLYLKKRWYIVAGGFLLGLSFAYLITHSSSLLVKKSRIGYPGLYTLDDLPLSISNLISYGLTQTDNLGKIIPSPIVENITVQNNNLDYLITIKQGILWHNGQELTTKDINYEIKEVTVQKINPYQLKFSLKTPYASFLSRLSRPLLLNDTIGLGEYRITSSIFQRRYIKKMILSSKKETVTFIFFPTQTDLITGYKLGEVNEIREVEKPHELNRWPKTSISRESDSSNRYLAVFLNSDTLSNKSIRQALNYATPKPSEKNIRCLGPISPYSWAYNPDVKEYLYNPARAKELAGKNIPEKIILEVRNRDLIDFAELIKKSWSETFNINIEIQISNDTESQADAWLDYYNIPQDPDQYPFWHSTQNTNVTKISNPRIDKLLEEGRLIHDFLERKKIYVEFQKILLEESPAIFISYPITYRLIRT